MNASRWFIVSGLSLDLIGALSVIVGTAKEGTELQGFFSPQPDRIRRVRRWSLGGVALIAVGFALQIVGVVVRS